MKYTISTTNELQSLVSDYLILPLYENDSRVAIKSFDKATSGQITQLSKQGDFTGKHATTFSIAITSGIKATRVLLLGLGKKEELTHTRYRSALLAAMNGVNKEGIISVTVVLPEATLELSQKISSAIEMAGHACYRFTEGKSEKAKPQSLAEIVLVIDKKEEKAAKTIVNQASALVLGMNFAKDLGNRAPNFLNPTSLAKEAESLAKTFKDTMKCDILDEAKMKKLGMGSLLAVAQGSKQPPKLIVLEYMNGKAKDKPLVLVGKGVTFDSGGISLKPGEAMDEMKYDMCGAASVLGAFKAIAKMDLKINAVAIIPSVENMPSGSAARPGDVVTSMSGQTIEILNTDAEGRLILCDALTYAEKYEPKAVVDIATLTGAIIIALGNIPSGLFANDQKLADALKGYADKTDDRVWQLPIWEDYQPLLDSNFADIANIGGRAGGSITAACFLARFTKKYAWAHLDIAGTAWKSGKEKGATARPVSLLVEFLKSYA